MRTQLTPLERRRGAVARHPPRLRLHRALCAGLGALAMAALHAEEAKLSVADGTGPEPELPKPNTSLIPTVDIAPAVGWQPGEAPTPAQGLAVQAFASGLEHPRWLYVLPNGDVLVAETNAPAREDDSRGIKNWIMGKVMERAGAGVPSADRITLLRDADRDGVAEIRTTFVSGLHSPFGMALADNDFYVANTDTLVRFPYTPGVTEITAQPQTLTELPAGPINHHWTKNVLASKDGSRLYVTVGSNSNVAENGIENEERRAALLEVDRKTGETTVFATGLRNPNGLAWEPSTSELWTVVNERDELGSDLVPDYLTSVQRGGFYGWPYSYYGAHVDERVKPQRPDLVENAIVPDYALGPHVAPLGLTFAERSRLSPSYANGAFIGLHGSWNRKPLSGYKVIFVPFRNGKPSGMPTDVLTGFLNTKGEARGRPVGVAIDGSGALLVADDVGNTIWRVSAAASARDGA